MSTGTTDHFLPQGDEPVPMEEGSGASGEELLAVAALHSLGKIPTSHWPMVAAHLVALGYEGEDLEDLASLSSAASAWEVAPLVPGALTELGAPPLSWEEEVVVVVRLEIALPGGRTLDHPLVRLVAGLAPEWDYPGGLVGEAWEMAEYLDCDCHGDSDLRRSAAALEAHLGSLPPLALPVGLARALAGSHNGLRST